VDAELARLVGGRADDAPLGGIAVAADHDRLSPELRPSQHLDGREELVEVDVQHPSGHSSKFRPLRS
jgi:hypothetical protein